MTTAPKKEKKQQMQVFVRVRPLNKQEGNNSVVEVVSAREINLKTHGGFKKFIYDRVFGPESKQIDVYKLVAEPAVKEVMSGYNCTVLAYGQTGTGKTYTMAGGNATDMSRSTSTSWFEDVDSGIIPRTMAHMFDELRVHQLEYTVRVSYLELYNEEIFDLLSSIEDNTKLKLYDDSMKKGSVIVSGLTEVTVNSKTEVFQVLEKGSEKRKFASTLMNSQSSRSHTVFCITLHTKENAVGSEDVLKMGKLYLVDLAGSENIRQSGATDLRAREAVSINQSLLTLGRCITKLIEHSGHVPYRESKLTRLLQDSLGGRTKATLIATVSPAACNTDETLNTLTYAFQAKSITNKPEINQRLSKKTLLKEYTEEIERLRKDLAATRMGKGVYLAEDNYDALLRQKQNFKEELIEKIAQLRVMEEQMVNTEQVCKELKMSLEGQQKDSEDKAIAIYSLKDRLEDQGKMISGLQQENELKRFLVEKYSQKVGELTSTAQELMTVVDNTSSDTHKLHDKLEVIADLNKHNKQVCEQHITEFNAKIDGIGNKLRDFHDYQFKYHKNMVDTLINLEKETSMFENKSQEMMNLVFSLCGNVNQQKIDIDCSVECTRLGFELAQCNIAQVIKTSQDTCLDKFDASLVQQIYNLISHIREQGKFYNKAVEHWREMVDTNYTKVTEFLGSCKNLILESKKDVRDHIDNEIRLCEHIKNELIDQVRVKKSFESALNAQYISVFSGLNDIKTLMGDYSMSSNEQTQRRVRELAGLHDNLQDLRSAYFKTSDNTCNFIGQFTDTLHQTTQKDYADIQNQNNMRSDINDTLEDYVKSVNELIQTHKDDVIASAKHIEEECNNEIRIQGDLVGDQFAKQSSGLQQTVTQLIEVKDSMKTDMPEMYDTVSNSTAAMRRFVDDNDTCCSEMDSILGTELDNCREGFRRLYTSSVKEYKVTGETPQRKTYRYPRTLPETQPEKLEEKWNLERLQESQEPEETENSEEKENHTNNEERILSENENNLPKSDVSRPTRLHYATNDSVIHDNN